ncbi:MAG TPA: zinc-ribbon domain-containing protein, partial [Solirubrobacterales bacterium]
MSETELSVICKNCGSEVSPYVTECPYCGTRLRKRAPKLERRDGALEAQRPRRRRRPRLSRRQASDSAKPFRPYATVAVILASAALLLIKL